MGQYGGRMDWSPTRFAAEYEDPISVAIRSVLSTAQSVYNNRQAQAEQKRQEERADAKEFERDMASSKRDLAMADLGYRYEAAQQEKDQMARLAKEQEEARRRTSLGGLYRSVGGMRTPDFNPDTAPSDVLEKAIQYAIERNKPQKREHIDPYSDEGIRKQKELINEREAAEARNRKPDRPANPNRDPGVVAARSDVRTSNAAYNAMLKTRPNQSDYKNILTGKPDTTAFNERMQNWRADSTEKADVRTGARAALDDLLKPDDDGPSVNQAEEQRAYDAAVARIAAANLPTAEAQQQYAEAARIYQSRIARR